MPRRQSGQGVVSVWRGLYGPLEKGVYSGVPDNLLRSDGITFDNRGVAQSGFSRFAFHPGSIFRKVEGLPVVFSQDEAAMYVPTGPYLALPAIVEARIAVDALADGKVRIIRNAGNEVDDFPITLAMIEAHIRGEKPIRGECFLPGVSREVTRDQHFYRPAVRKEGGLYIVGYDLSWQEVELGHGGIERRGGRKE